MFHNVSGTENALQVHIYLWEGSLCVGQGPTTSPKGTPKKREKRGKHQWQGRRARGAQVSAEWET